MVVNCAGLALPVETSGANFFAPTQPTIMRMWLCCVHKKTASAVMHCFDIREANPDARFCWRTANIAPDICCGQ
ncbi:hypothetical protein CIX30_25495 [Salmonella enterica]|uniref:Uncharacterized protein n=1 Tax=Salmonella enterica I TaxID=59201 RepID=A0A3R1AEH5_SALET|nr:hypothetical protein [Salmonella enterica]ECD2093695.1 hypothetical protein [Salmonella enterica subsp. enterica serovar Poano]ECU7994149.1 hypothetical protein [Salmonella enterica subsp. enterica serovar Toucra]MML56876.1 hypothetical protein [Salmonella enterica subsp. enterica serovar Kidderminster]EAP9510842.1 hypothetical protein [Salmonella enterica]